MRRLCAMRRMWPVYGRESRAGVRSPGTLVRGTLWPAQRCRGALRAAPLFHPRQHRLDDLSASTQRVPFHGLPLMVHPPGMPRAFDAVIP